MENHARPSRMSTRPAPFSRRPDPVDPCSLALDGAKRTLAAACAESIARCLFSDRRAAARPRGSTHETLDLSRTVGAAGRRAGRNSPFRARW
jgi:hypothetical protein